MDTCKTKRHSKTQEVYENDDIRSHKAGNRRKRKEQSIK